MKHKLEALELIWKEKFIESVEMVEKNPNSLPVLKFNLKCMEALYLINKLNKACRDEE